jgi:hypothetical protein
VSGGAPRTEAPDAPGDGGASPVPLVFTLALLIPAFAVVAYVLGRLWAPIRLPDPPTESDPDEGGGEDRDATP